MIAAQIFSCFASQDSCILLAVHLKVATRLWRIRGHKGQNSTGTPYRGFLVLESRFRGFWSWNLDAMAFWSLEKRLGITMSWVNYLRFSMSWFFGLGILMSWFFGLGISMSWFFGLGISMSWYMCLHGLVFVIIVITKKSHIIMSIMLLKNMSVVQIYATSICTMYA